MHFIRIRIFNTDHSIFTVHSSLVFQITSRVPITITFPSSASFHTIPLNLPHPLQFIYLFCPLSTGRVYLCFGEFLDSRDSAKYHETLAKLTPIN